MKKIIITIFTVSIFTNIYGQAKRDNTIIIDTVISLQNLKLLLFQNGYNYEGTDTLFITTSAKQINGAVVMKLNIARIDTSIILKAQRKVLVEGVLWGNTIKEEFSPVFMWKIKGSIETDCWLELNKIAMLIGSKRRYLKQ